MNRLLRMFFGLALFVATLWLGWSFRDRNATSIDLDLIWIQFPDVELWWVILVTISVGAVLSTLLVGFAWMRSRLLNRRYRRAIRRLESELHEMRSLPLMGSNPPQVVSTSEQG